MAKKIVNTKIQIPKWYTKRIKNFEKLTENEALFEYESLKLRERYRKTANKLKKEGFIVEKIAPKIARPHSVIESDINYLKRIEPETIREAVIQLEPIVKYDAPIYDYEDPYWKEENLPDYHYQGDYDYSDYDYTEDTVEPEPTPPLYVDMTTGEAIYEEDLPDYMDRLSDFIDDLIDETRQEMDRAIVSYSAYRSGKTRNARGRAWIETNITRAGNKLISKLEEIKSNENSLKTFAQKCNNPDYMQQLKDAVGDYISSSYYIVDIDGYFSNSKVYNLLSFSPMSLDDAMDFEYEE